MSQADDYARAIDTALHEVAKTHARPELNAMLGALAVRTGNGLSLVADQKMRDQVFDKVCAEIKRTMNTPTTEKAELVPVVADSKKQGP